MTTKPRLQRRQFLVASGVALAQTVIAGRASRAAPPSKPAAPPNPPVPVPKPAAPPGLAIKKPGVAPGYIVSGRGEDLSNPYFHPLGGRSNQPRPIPAEAHGKGVNENDQGENQQ